jgi:hypothetical protein
MGCDAIKILSRELDDALAALGVSSPLPKEEEPAVELALSRS